MEEAARPRDSIFNVTVSRVIMENFVKNLLAQELTPAVTGFAILIQTVIKDTVVTVS